MKRFKPYDVLKNKKINYPELSNEVKYEVSILGGLDIFTDAHVSGVTDITTKICEELNMDYERLKHMVVGAYLHDVGKIMIPKEVLQKNGRLTDEEYEIIKTHTTHGYDICMKYRELRQYAHIARWHHESFDGSGYPDKLVGAQIPFAKGDDGLADEAPVAEEKLFLLEGGAVDEIHVQGQGAQIETVAQGNPVHHLLGLVLHVVVAPCGVPPGREGTVPV